MSSERKKVGSVIVVGMFFVCMVVVFISSLFMTENLKRSKHDQTYSRASPSRIDASHHHSAMEPSNHRSTLGINIRSALGVSNRSAMEANNRSAKEANDRSAVEANERSAMDASNPATTTP